MKDPLIQSTVWRGRGALALVAALAVMPVVLNSTTASGATSACPAGLTAQGPSQVETTVDGGEIYTYPTPIGTVTEPVPPAGFQPLQATDEQLALYGFPARPTDPDALAAWTSLLSAYQTSSPPSQCWNLNAPVADFKQSSDGIQPLVVAYDTSPNWGGYVAEPSSSNLFKGVAGEYHQPPRKSTSCTNARQSEWVGLGGYGTFSNGGFGLIQDGTEFDTSGSPYGFYEWIGSNSAGGATTGVAAQHFSIGVGVGDHIYVSTTYAPSTGIATFYIENQTTGTQQTFKAKTAQWYDGSTTDWIVERPGPFGGQPGHLQNFNSVSWTGAEAFNTANDWVYLDSTHEQINITMKQNGTTFAQTGGVGGANGGAFTTTWEHC
jgi:hypothetical protein